MPNDTIGGSRAAHRITLALSILLLAASLAFSWTTAWSVTAKLLDSDASSQLVLARILSEEGGVTSRNWFYSTELEVFQSNVVHAPLFRLFSDWHMVRFIGVILLQILLLLSYYALCRQLRLDLRAFFISAAMLMLPFSVAYGRLVLYHTYYLPYTAFGFCMVALYLSAMERLGKGARGWPCVWRITLLLALAFATSLSGVRQLLITMVPMLLTAFARAWHQERDGLAPRGFARWRGMALPLAVCCAGAVGYLVNSRVLAERFSYSNYGETMLTFPSADSLRSLLWAVTGMYGFQTDRPLFSVGGVLACGGVLAAADLLIRGGRALLGRDDAPNESQTFTRVFYPVTLLVTLAALIFLRVDENHTMYLLLPAIWAIPALGTRIDAALGRKPDQPLRRLLLAAVCVALLCNGCYNNLFFREPEGSRVQYEGIVWKDTGLVRKLSGAAEYLGKNGYTLGYSTYWYANIVTEMTDGQISMVGIEDDAADARYVYYDWLSDKRLRDPAYVARQKTFFLLSVAQRDFYLATALAAESELVYEDEYFAVYGFAQHPTAVCDDAAETIQRRNAG